MKKTMKVILLLAGRGRRLGELTKNRHKSLLELLGRPLLGLLVEGFVSCGLREFVPVLGYDKENVLEYIRDNFRKEINLTPVYNPRFEETNNLYSLWCARKILSGDEFLVCNGDLVLDKSIIENLLGNDEVSAVTVDDSPRAAPIDSPGVIVRDNRIYDLGRHIPFEQSGGYAIGLYKFNRQLSSAFFSEADKVLKNNINAGFHDPLRALFERYANFAQSTKHLPWFDIDVKEDITYAEKILEEITQERSKQLAS